MKLSKKGALAIVVFMCLKKSSEEEEEEKYVDVVMAWENVWFF